MSWALGNFRRFTLHLNYALKLDKGVVPQGSTIELDSVARTFYQLHRRQNFIEKLCLQMLQNYVEQGEIES